MSAIPEFDYSTLLASSVHEVKNSLNMLLNSIDEISSGCAGNGCAQKETLTYIKYEGNRISDDLVELLSIYRIQNNQYFARIDEYCVHEFLEEILEQHDTMFKYRNIGRKLICDASLNWFFDRDLISVVISNVINNMYKYTQDMLEMEVTNDNGYLTIRVKDNGPGYPDWMINCENGKQHAISLDQSSTGLGLYFSRLVAELHKNKGKHGFIETTNDGIDGGGCFTIHLP